MSNNQISLLKFNYKTNVRGHTKYVPYSILNRKISLAKSLISSTVSDGSSISACSEFKNCTPLLSSTKIALAASSLCIVTVI